MVQVRHLPDLISQIYVAAAASNCVYPDNSTPTCVAGMTCGFTCTDGFSPSPDSNPTTCVCSAPLVNCNGQCVAAGACASNSCQAPSKKRSWVGSGLCADMGPGWVACGVLGRGHRRSWECVNAARDLESCKCPSHTQHRPARTEKSPACEGGGCIYPLTSHSPIGKDCSILSGVADVSCLGGECVVHRCLPGYVPAFDGTSCIRKRHHSQYSSQLAHTKDAPARMYGPGHAPLGRN